MQSVPRRLYYRIGDVCRIVGVEAHVLRYWETEFPILAPPKNKAGQRTYRPKDIELILLIRKLLYEEGYTIAGARRRLVRGVSGEGSAGDWVAGALPPGKRSRQAPAQRINQVREELENILTLLERE